MGGHAGGDRASQCAIDTYNNLTKKGLTAAQIIKQIPDALARQLQQDKSNGLKTNIDMGTTILVAEIRNGTAFFSHVGDSRVGVFRKGEVLLLSKDDSLVSTLGLSEKDAMAHPDNNVVTKALFIKNGMPGPGYLPTQTEFALKRNDVIIMASDGLWDFVHSSEVNRIITRNGDPDKIRDALMKLVSERRGDDNISIVVIRY